MKRRLRIIAVVLISISSFSAIQAQITTGSISGSVTDVLGVIVLGARVAVRERSGGNYTTTVNRSGDLGNKENNQEVL